jgi:hypothetical protein
VFGCHDAKVVSGELKCCEKELAELPTGQQQKGCSGCQSTYVSLDADYLLFPAELKISLPAIAFFQKPIICSEKYSPEKTTTYWKHDLPPPPYGKNLLPFIQSFLC